MSQSDVSGPGSQATGLYILRLFLMVANNESILGQSINLYKYEGMVCCQGNCCWKWACFSKKGWDWNSYDNIELCKNTHLCHIKYYIDEN